MATYVGLVQFTDKGVQAAGSRLGRQMQSKAVSRDGEDPGVGVGVRTRWRALSPATLPTGLVELLRYLQSVLNHPGE